MGLLDALIYGLRDVFDNDDNQLPRRSRIKYTTTITDDPENDRLVVDTGGGGGGGSPGTPSKAVQTNLTGAFKALENWNREGTGHLNEERHVLTGFPELIFDSGTKTITRVSGSWLTDGFTTGPITIRNITSTPGNNGSKTVTLVSSTVLTLSDTVTDDDIAGGDVLADAVTIEQGAFQTCGLSTQLNPDQGYRRLSQLATDEPDRVLDAGIDSSGNSIPITSVSRNDEVMQGGSFDQENSNSGTVNRWNIWAIWSVFHHWYVDVWEWREQSIVYEHKNRGKVNTTDATPTTLPMTIPTKIVYEVEVTARSSTGTSVWRFLMLPDGTVTNTLANASGGGSSSSWLCTFSGTTVTVTGFASTNIAWKATARAT